MKSDTLNLRSSRQIAVELGVLPSTLRRFADELGIAAKITVDDSRAYFTQPDAEKLADAVRHDMPATRIERRSRYDDARESSHRRSIKFLKTAHGHAKKMFRDGVQSVSVSRTDDVTRFRATDAAGRELDRFELRGLVGGLDESLARGCEVVESRTVSARRAARANQIKNEMRAARVEEIYRDQRRVG